MEEKSNPESFITDITSQGESFWPSKMRRILRGTHTPRETIISV